MNQDYWRIEKINNKSQFLAHLIEQAPIGSFWQGNGIHDHSITEFLQPYLTQKSLSEWEKLGNQEKDFFEVQLNEQNKPLIAQKILEWDLERNLQDQTIIFEGRDYLKSYDFLDPSCTWVNRNLDLNALIQKDIIQLEK